MYGQTEIAPIGQLVLGRLLVAGDKGATGAELKKALEPVMGHRWSGAALMDRIGQELWGLETAGLVFRAKKGRTERSALTQQGRHRILGLFGLDDLPHKTTWDKFKKTYLAARALGLNTPRGEDAKRFATDNGFKSALLRARFELPLHANAKVEEAIAALCWTLLGLPAGRKFDVKTVQAALIRRALGEGGELGPKPDPKKEAAKLLAKEVGARQAGKDELRTATLRRWVEEPVVSLYAPSPNHGEEPDPHTPFDEGGVRSTASDLLDEPLTEFSQRVLAAARATTSGRFGDNKVFIAHVWRTLASDPQMISLGLDAFKHRLAEANQARLLDLARADLVEAMDPDDVRTSEVSHLGATFHFVRI
jgi:hypothetical protein